MGASPDHGSATGRASRDGTTMRAVVQDAYGPPEVLRLEAVDRPVPAPDEVLVRVRAAAVNPADWHVMRGVPYAIRLRSGLRAPTRPGRGTDVAGRVETVGDDVTQFRPGDEVYGGASGAFAEFATARTAALAPKPTTLTFEEAAAVPVAGVTALQGLRDVGRLEPGESILVNGASGGVGSFAVQIAAEFGATVTGVCSGRNAALVRSLGADRVIDYTREDFAEKGTRYELVFDLVGNRSLSALRRVTTSDGTVVLCGGGGGRWIGALTTVGLARVASPFVSQRIRTFLARVTAADLEALSALVGGGKVEPVIDRTYPLAEAADAVRYLETGHARGKVVLAV